jgi:predicted esterase
MRHLSSILSLSALAAVLPSALQDTKPPSSKETSELIEAFFEADARTYDGFAEQRKILERLDQAPELSAKDVERWTKKLLEQWEQGPEIPKKSGRAFFWDEEDRGMYIVGGEKRKPKALALCMHGGGEGEGDAWASHGAYNPTLSGLDWLAIYPEVLEKTEHGWTDSGTEEFVMDLVERTRRTWEIDPNRVFFCGHSMGGYGTWMLGSRHADVVAALAPSAGAPSPLWDASGVAVDIVRGVIPNLRNVPIVIYQSDDDVQVPPDANRAAAKKLAEAKELWGGFDFEYWEVSGRGHTPPPGGYEAHLDKIAHHVRNPHPDTVIWEPSIDWKRQFYWLWWEFPLLSGLVEARLDREKNEVHVECSVAPKGLYVLLGPEIVDMDEEVAVFLNKEEVFRGKPQRSLSTLLLTGVRGDPDLMYEARIELAP